MRYIKNDQLITVRTAWPGTPLDEEGRFVNINKPFKPSFAKVLRWRFTPNPQKEEKKSDTWRPAVRTDGAMLREAGDMIVWLGHASFLIRLSGRTFIFDPVFYGTSFIPREIPLPVPPGSLRNIDYLLLSHGHMDHCDRKSIQLLARNNQLEVLTGLRMGSLLTRWVPGLDIQEAGWYQAYQLKEPDLRIVMLPSLHWYKRTLSDDNRRLWGSFILQTPEWTIYFSGDSGYDAHFREIGELFPQPDICLMGVGAYSPAFMMQDNHMSPLEAVRGFNDMKGKTFIPMHYGTFNLSDEPLGEPVRLLRRLEAEGNINGQLKVLDAGEVYRLTKERREERK